MPVNFTFNPFTNNFDAVRLYTGSLPLSIDSSDNFTFVPAGSDTNFLYNNAGVLGATPFFNYATDNIPTIGDGNAQITSIGTCTISNATPAVVTKASHGLSIGDRVTFRSSGGVPSPLHPSDTFDGAREYYYIISAGFTSGAFQISLTRGGAAINTTTAGSGTHTLFKYVNYQLDFNSDKDALIEWRKDPSSAAQWTLSVRRSDDQYFQYPGYAARFAVNCTQVTDYESPVAFSAFINAGANTSELYGFWGGVYDTGPNAFNITSQGVGILCYNYLGGSNARTLANIVGGDFTSEMGSNITGTNVIGGRFQAIVAATSATFTNAYGVQIKSSVGTLTNNYGLHIASMTGATNNYGAFFTAASNASFRAGTQAIWSSAASTLDITTATTLNLKIGANPANGTAGTINAIFNASGLAIGATSSGNYALEIPAYLNSKRFFFNFSNSSALTGISAWGGGVISAINTGTTSAAGTLLNLSLTTSQTAATHTGITLAVQGPSHTSNFMRGLNLNVAGAVTSGTDQAQGGFINVAGAAATVGYTYGLGRGATAGAANAASGDIIGNLMDFITADTTGQSYGMKMTRSSGTYPTVAYTIQGWGHYNLLDDDSWDIGVDDTHRVRTIRVGTSLRMIDADIVTDTTTGMMLCTTTTQKWAAWGATPIVQPTAFTQTYATASKTHANVTSSAVATTGAVNITPYGYTTAAQADAIPVAINAVAADLLNLKQVVNAIIDDGQAEGLLA